MKTEIKNYWSGAVIASGEGTVKEVLIAADLRGADLSDAVDLPQAPTIENIDAAILAKGSQ